MSFITFDRVAKSFGSKTVLTSLSMSLAAGQSLVLLGRSGTGKSVSLKCFLGLMKPDSGSIELDGLSVIGLSPMARRAQMDRVGMLFQGGALFDSLPVWRNIAFRLIEQVIIGRAVILIAPIIKRMFAKTVPCRDRQEAGWDDLICINIGRWQNQCFRSDSVDRIKGH